MIIYYINIDKTLDKRRNTMNIKRIVLALGLALASGAAGFIGFTNISSKEPAVEAKADTVASSTTIYVEVCDAWVSDGAVPRLYVSPATSSWVKPSTIKTANSETGQHALYSFTVPAGVTEFNIMRMNPSDPDASSGMWNSTGAIQYSTSYNYYNVTSLSGNVCPYDSGWMNVYYRSATNYQSFNLTVINEDYNWFDANATTYIRFWDGTEIKFDKFIPYYNSAIYTNTLTCTTTVTSGSSSPIYAAGFNIFRKSSDGSETYSQTGNWAFTGENKDMNAFVIKAKTGDAQFYDGEGQSKVIGDEYNAMAYGIYFLEKTDSICSGNEESNNYSALSAVWNQFKGAATASTNGNKFLSSDEAKAAFKTSSEHYTNDAYQRYAHMVNKYSSLEDFLNVRTSSGSRFVNNNLTNSSAIVIITISVLALSIVSATLIVIKRRKVER